MRLRGCGSAWSSRAHEGADDPQAAPETGREEQESGASEVLAKVLQVDLPVARESYRISRNAFSMSGVVSQRQIEEFLKMDAEIAKIPDPLRATAAFDFALQHEVNNELGIK